MHDTLTAGLQGLSHTSAGQHHCMGTQPAPCGALCAPAQCLAKHMGTLQTAGNLTASTTLLPCLSPPGQGAAGHGQVFPLTTARAAHSSFPQSHQDGPGHSRPREGAQPCCSCTHISKGDTWTLYKNHKRFCTHTWGHGGESLPSLVRGERRSPYPPRDTIHIFDVLKTNQAQTHSTCRGAAAPAPPGRTRGSGSHSGTSQ